MRDLVEYVAKALVNDPESVKVTEEDQDGNLLIRIEVAEDDKGRIIGKQGRVAQAMRTLLRVAAVKQGIRVVLEIV